jgi:signal transduction histidine kinase
MAIILKLLNMNSFSIFYILSIGVLCCIFYVVFDYTKRNRFYKNMERCFKGLDKKYLITELIKRPDFSDGRIFYDILDTSTKSMNDEIRKYRDQMASYREYIEMWIHEVKTPLASAKLMTENHKNEVSRFMDDELNQIEYYLDQALYYARSTGVEKDYMVRETNLAQIVEKAIKSNARMLITSKIKIEMGDLSCSVFTDEKWVEFILKQIIVNSVKYKKGETGCIRFEAKEIQEMVILKISDEGIGISKKDLPKVMEKGYTGTSGRKYVKSTGMGLYLCKELSRKLAISFYIESEEGIGTDVFLGFPRNSMTFFKKE